MIDHFIIFKIIFKGRNSNFTNLKPIIYNVFRIKIILLYIILFYPGCLSICHIFVLFNTILKAKFNFHNSQQKQFIGFISIYFALNDYHSLYTHTHTHTNVK